MGRDQKRKDPFDEEKAIYAGDHPQTLPQILLPVGEVFIMVVAVIVVVEAEDLKKDDKIAETTSWDRRTCDSQTAGKRLCRGVTADSRPQTDGAAALWPIPTCGMRCRRASPERVPTARPTNSCRMSA